ncbi:chitinase 2-like [Curcuma longa]|uniref:chitinase 2-like n=1 Tax=Curcuma longa TaxID=136217 RepID=UPI003D9E5C61
MSYHCYTPPPGMASSSSHPFFFDIALLLLALASSPSAANSNLFREYIGADSSSVSLSDVPINPGVEFHFILSFAVDFTLSAPHFPTDGVFAPAWDTARLTPAHVAAFKCRHPNAKVALSLGGDTLGDVEVYFVPFSVDTWVDNALASLTRIIQQYHLDGVDIDYEHFVADPETFAECIGRLLAALKAGGTISFASIAPFDDEEVQRHYAALWMRHAHLVDYVNFQFYAYSGDTTVAQFLRHFDEQRRNYAGGKVLVSFATDDEGADGGLSPERGFFNASRILKGEGRLDGIFVWSADDSKRTDFRYEVQSQELLASKY